MSKRQFIYFVTVTEKVYDPKTHKYSTEVNAVGRYAGVADLGTKRTMELFGNLDTLHKVIRMRYPYNDSFQYIYYDGVVYKKDFKRATSNNNSFIISEEVVSKDVRESIISGVTGSK